MYEIAAQDAEPLPCLYQFFVRECTDKFAVIVFTEFAETDGAVHRDTHGWGFAAETGDKSNTGHVVNYATTGRAAYFAFLNSAKAQDAYAYPVPPIVRSTDETCRDPHLHRENAIARMPS